MTSSSSIIYPKPSDWQNFERLCRALLTDHCNRQFLRWGRGGQRQDGIDLFMLQEDGRAIVLQCKGRTGSDKTRFTTKDIDSAVSEIKNFPHPIEEFIILTTADDDVKLHNHAASLSVSRLSQGECKVSVWGWNHISDLIGVSERTQRSFYGHWFQRLSLSQWGVRAGLAALFIVVGAITVSYAIDERRTASQSSIASAKDLRQFVRSTDDLAVAYSMCEAMLAKHMFVFSRDLKASCTDPISKKVSTVTSQVEKLGASLDSSAWSEVDDLSKLMLEDHRQGLIALEMTNGFEEDVIRSLKDMCIRTRDKSLLVARNKSLYEAGRRAMVAQLHYFFTVRDFILPGLASMKARALVHARSIISESVPEKMKEKANALSSILQERKGFSFKEPKQPFTLSVIKDRSSRDIKISVDDGLDFVEQARWQQVLMTARLDSLYDRPDDIESLISCGVLKPEARQLASKPAK